jgi:glycosyltransferase involved in cell wall biosynthesis
MDRVLLVGKGPPDRGGIPSFLQGLMASELSRRYDLSFLNVAHAGTPEGGRLSVGNIRRTLHDAVSVWRRAGQQDVIHINSALAPSVTVIRAGLLVLAGRMRGCAVIVHAHGGNIETWLTSRWARWVTRASMNRASLVVAVWNAGKVALASTLDQQRVRLVVNGVDTTRFRPATTGSHDPPRVLYVGLLTPRKGVLDLIEASQTIRRAGIDHELWLLGGVPDEGPEAAEPVLAAAKGHAVLLGTRPPEEMPEVYASADVFCLPSWWEAMPLSVLEAMASGLPVVATEVGDVARIVVHGETGLVVPPQSPEELAAALRKVVEDPESARRMGRAGRERAETVYSSSANARAIGDLYDEVLSGDPR